MRKARIWWAALVLAGCNGPSASSGPAINRHPLYYDVKGLLETQIKRLDQQHPAVLKQVSLRGGTPETVRVATVKWADELQVFFQADINKAALRGAYAVDSVALPGGGLRRTYTRRPGQANAPVARLTVVSNGPDANEVEAVIQQHNPLFSTQKHLQLTLRGQQLRSYTVQGQQKLILFDTLRYAAAEQVE